VKIKSMTATFGRLNRARLELGPGLNLIYAPNEGGKSTWCAFWKAMLYGIDTRDRDKKGYLADKNRYQPWSGAPMEGEVTLEVQGRSITIRRGPKGSVPFAAFSAVYTGTEEPVPGLTADNCGELLAGAGREVFERSAFIGSGGSLTVTAAPELERRIAALVSSGEEDVSFSQTEARLKEWLNRRKVNKSVGIIPKLEGELDQVRADLAALEDISARIAQLEGDRTALEREKQALEEEKNLHLLLAREDLNLRFAQADRELETARTQLAALEREAAKYGARPDRELLKKAQGELQYLKVLDEEIRQGDAALKEAEEAYVQTQIAAQDDRFPGMTGGEAVSRAEKDFKAWEQACLSENAQKRRSRVLQVASALIVIAVASIQLIAGHPPEFLIPGLALLAAAAVCLVLSSAATSRGKNAHQEAARLLNQYETTDPENILKYAQDYAGRQQEADQAAQRSKTIRGTLNDRKARRDNSRADLLRFVHTFAPQVSDLFGCSAALSRALNLDHELALARERTEERLRRRDDLAAQGGQCRESQHPPQSPVRTPAETAAALAQVSNRLEQISRALNQDLGSRRAMGDPAALAARREELEGTLERRAMEYSALSAALSALTEANSLLQERFSPALNQLTGQYLSRLTGGAYTSVTLNRDLEGAASRGEDVLPHSALYLSRGTADQLYLALRLAVCQLCLPEKPPILLDDALAAFDDLRLASALDLLEELARKQQILLFTCQRREGASMGTAPGVVRLELS